MILLDTIPEFQPALLSLIYMGGLVLVGLWLALSLLRGRRRRQRSALSAVAPADLPEEVRQRLGVTSTNRGLQVLRWSFAAAAIAVFGFHVYWGHYASESNEKFQELNYKDLRNRRLAESTLRGWILDRTGRLDHALALYKYENNQIVREYPLDTATSHLLGSDRGDPGLERALFGIQSNAAPEAWDIVMGRNIKQPANLDVRLTIDDELQKEAVDQLRGRTGAVVVLNPQTGEVLAMYSNPSYSIKAADDEATWIKLEADKRDNPLLNRALNAYYVPGSTFKTITMTAAFLAGIQDTQFVCTSGGYVAAPGAPPIPDDGGPREVHGRIGIDTAYEVSCNQYFAQMGDKLGPGGLKKAAQLLGIGTYDTPADLLRGRREPQLWNASSDAIKRALAPSEATILTSSKMTRYDLALEGFGQGYVGQMTPFQMALAASAIANMDGRLMKPKIELDRPPEAFSQVMPPQTAATLRGIMGLVTGGPRGTGRAVFAPVQAAGITTGGKTGTAQKEVPVYNPVTGEPEKIKKVEKDRRGQIIREYEVDLMAPEKRIDSWFLAIAPLERPQIAIAVIIEGGGYGARAAAPVAAALVLKARDLGLLGDVPAVNNNNNPAPANQNAPGAAGKKPAVGRRSPTPSPTATGQ